jgi:hypothetical protein
MTNPLESAGGLTLLDALNAAAAEGFVHQFMIDQTGEIRCVSGEHRIKPDEITPVRWWRLEGPTDPDDMLMVTSFSCPRCGVRGSITLAYGPHASATDMAVATSLQTSRATAGGAPDHSDPAEEIPTRLG